MPRILVADDSWFQRANLQQLLVEDGFEVSLAANGAEALALASAQAFALALVDLNMPVMDGIEFLEEIRRRGSSLPVVILTADVQRTTRARCVELGAAGFLNKPLDLGEFHALLAHLPVACGEQVCG